VSKIEPRGEPRVIAGEAAVRAERPAVGERGSCFGCGYALSGLPASVAACPECGRFIDDRPSPDPIGPVSAGEARAAVWGAGIALAGLAAVAVAPFVGAVVEAAGWWRLTAGPGEGRRSAPRVRGLVRTLTVVSVLGQCAMWATLSAAYLGGGSSVAAEVTAGSVATAAIALWTLRHVAGCWWVGRLGRRADVPSLSGLALTSGVGAAAITTTGVVLIGLGVLVSHLALFPPLCFALPLWVAGLAGWWLVTAVMFVRVRTAMRGVVEGDGVAAVG